MHYLGFQYLISGTWSAYSGKPPINHGVTVRPDHLLTLIICPSVWLTYILLFMQTELTVWKDSRQKRKSWCDDKGWGEPGEKHNHFMSTKHMEVSQNCFSMACKLLQESEGWI